MDHEILLEPGKPIVTRTDPQGIITYANESFVGVSGYARDELIGRPHNVVRHPDMPAEAFRDLWATVRAGLPWRGMVKNRAKDGRFYWVDAYVTPITENGATIGYLSVRNPPARDEVAAADALYRRIREGRATFPRSPLAKDGWPARMRAVLPPAVLVATPPGLGALLDLPPPGVAAAALGAAICGCAALAVREERRFRKLADWVRGLDEGRLGEPIPRQSGTAREPSMQLESLRIHLRAIFADVLISSREVACQAEELENGMRTLGAGAMAQSERAMETAAAMEELSVSVNEIAGNTDIGLDAAHRTESISHAGSRVIAEGIAAIHRVMEAASASQAQVRQIDEAVGRIGGLTAMIREISEQTNLLALNAAIEAARAGEHGRGFSVVADEICKLAEKTRLTTNSIGQAIDGILEQVGDAVKTMGRVVEEVGDSTGKIEASRRSLGEIVEASRQAVASASDITEMLRRQTHVSHDVAASMEQIAALAERSNTSIKGVAHSTQRLRNVVRALTAHLERSVA